MKKNIVFSTLGLWLLLVSASSCGSFHEFPEEPELPGDDDVTLGITLDFDFQMLAQPTKESLAAITAGRYDTRYVIEFYRSSDMSSCEKRMVLQGDPASEGVNSLYTEVTLKSQNYRMMAWVDFVPRDSREDHHYTTVNGLASVKVATPYKGSLETKDAFSGSMNIDLVSRVAALGESSAAAPVPLALTLERPFAKYMIVSTDVVQYKAANAGKEWAEIKPVKVRIRHSGYFRHGYNVHTSAANDMKENVVFECQPLSESATEVVLASDYVFVTRDNDPISLMVEVLDGEDNIIKTTITNNIALERNKLTIRGNGFLLRKAGEGAITIIDGYDGDDVIIDLDS